MSKVFRETEKQKEATKLLSSPATHIMLYGGSRSGKTFKFIRSMIIRACKTKSRHAILRLNFNHAKTSIWLDTLPKVLDLCFPRLRWKPSGSDYYIKFSNESEIWIAGLDDAKRVEKILGKEYSTLFFNECSQIPYSSITTALTRLAEKNDLRKKAYYDENPPNKKHWSYWQFIKKLDPVENEPLKDDSDYVSMLMNPKDNLQNIDEKYLSILSKLPEKERLRFLLGEFTDDSDGLAYYAFDRDKHVRETTRKLGTIMIGLDFNVMPMCAVVGQYYNRTFHIIDEVYLENSDTPKMCAYLLKHNYAGNVYPDSTGRNRKTSGQSDFDILKNNGFRIQSTINPHQYDRVNNINRLFQENRIIISPKCKKLINDLERVSWKDNKLDQKTDTMLTHISDALGYWCWNVDPITSYEKVMVGSYQK